MKPEDLARKNCSIWLNLTTYAYETWYGYRSYPIGELKLAEYVTEANTSYEVFQRIA